MHYQKTLGTFALALALLVSGGSAALAQTTTPGVPDTGTGEAATVNLIVLGASALLAVGAGLYLRQKSAKQH